MKGYIKIVNGHEYDVSPCAFCKHCDCLTVENPCYSCIDDMDIAQHKKNTETDFSSFVPKTPAHLEVLKWEQGHYRNIELDCPSSSGSEV